MISDEIRKRLEMRAMELWRARELDYPPRVRRMAPDDLDRASGAWDRMLLRAAEELGISVS